VIEMKPNMSLHICNLHTALAAKSLIYHATYFIALV